jgi:type I restriction enzyme S subunit
LALFFNSEIGTRQSIALATGGTRPALDYSAIRSMKIPLPPRKVQDHIAQIMQDAYATRQAKLAQAQQLLDGISKTVLAFLKVEISEIIDEPRFTIRSSMLEDRLDFKVYDRRYTSVISAIEQGPYVITNLGSLCEKAPHRGTQPKYTADGDVLVLKTVNVDAGDIDFDRALHTTREFLESRAGQRARPQKGDVLITSTGDGSWGRASVFNSEVECVVDGHITIVRLKPECNPYYLQAFLNSPLGQAQFWQRYRGHTGQTEFYPGDIVMLKVSLPPRQLQDEIANEVDRRRVSAKRLQLEANEEVVKAKALVERMILGEEVI